MSINISGDGLVENLFHLLWTKEVKYKKNVPIYIPDTIIYKYEQPSFWYFTAKNGEIMRKSKKNLSNEKIEESFLQNISQSGIVAFYMYNKKERNIISTINMKKNKRGDSSDQECDEEDLVNQL